MFYPKDNSLHKSWMTTVIHLDYCLGTFERSQINFRKIVRSIFFNDRSTARTYLFSLALRKIKRRKKVKNEPISRMIEHFDSANGGITFLDIHTLSRGSSWANDVEQGQPAGEKRNDEKRECEKRQATNERGVAPWCFELFYSLNIGPNQTPSILRAREYKCSPSRLYNHGSVKLTSQSCN